MRGFAEFGIFFAIATASHFAVFQPERTGAPEAMGDEGAQMLTLAASSASLTALVQAWERPVDVLQQVAMPEVAMPEAADAPVVRPEASAVPVQPQAMQLAMQEAVQQAPDLPTIDTANPTQPGFAAVQSARPKLRPPAAPVRLRQSPQRKRKLYRKRHRTIPSAKWLRARARGRPQARRKRPKPPQNRRPPALRPWRAGGAAFAAQSSGVRRIPPTPVHEAVWCLLWRSLPMAGLRLSGSSAHRAIGRSTMRRSVR